MMRHRDNWYGGRGIALVWYDGREWYKEKILWRVWYNGKGMGKVCCDEGLTPRKGHCRIHSPLTVTRVFGEIPDRGLDHLDLLMTDLTDLPLI